MQTEPISHPDFLDFADIVDTLVQQQIDLWWQAESALPTTLPVYPLKEKLRREKLLANFMRFLATELNAAEQGSFSSPEGRAKQERLMAAARSFAVAALDLDAQQIETFLQAGFQESALAFTRLARAFDADICAEDVYQAGRNAWSMNLFQYLFGLPIQITPAVFAYSLLYPYTDNYLDDPSIAWETKREANLRLTARLAGEACSPGNAHEQRIFDLVGIIEGEFDRERFPLVYASLLAIQQAQVESLKLIAPEASPYDLDVLRLSIYKGGAATLADGYLVAGTLTPAQREFAFAYGAFTQLVDDQEDLFRDRNAGLMTIFSQTSRAWRLDAVTGRLLAYKELALRGMREMEPIESSPIANLVLKGIDLLILDGASRSERFHSYRYLRTLETYFPFRFSEVGRQRRILQRRKVSLTQAMSLFI